MLLDIFKGVDPKRVSLEGIEHTIVITQTEDSGKLLFRVYRINKKRGDSQNIPRVELVEMGPSFDFTIGRERLPDFTMWKASMKKPTNLSNTQSTDSSKKKTAKRNKNISTDGLGQTIGRIHLGRQDYTELNTVHRKVQNPIKVKKQIDTDAENPQVNKRPRPASK
jgi:ribosome production factor 2